MHAGRTHPGGWSSDLSRTLTANRLGRGQRRATGSKNRLKNDKDGSGSMWPPRSSRPLSSTPHLGHIPLILRPFWSFVGSVILCQQLLCCRPSHLRIFSPAVCRGRPVWNFAPGSCLGAQSTIAQGLVSSRHVDFDLSRRTLSLPCSSSSSLGGLQPASPKMGPLMRCSLAWNDSSLSSSE